jgi:hypothetical protein
MAYFLKGFDGQRAPARRGPAPTLSIALDTCRDRGITGCLDLAAADRLLEVTHTIV